MWGQTQILHLELHNVQWACSCCPFFSVGPPLVKMLRLLIITWRVEVPTVCLPLGAYLLAIPWVISLSLLYRRGLCDFSRLMAISHTLTALSSPSQKPNRKSKLPVFSPPSGCLPLKLKLRKLSFFFFLIRNVLWREKKGSCPNQ